MTAKKSVVLLLFAIGLATARSEAIYDERADARDQLRAAISQASRNGKLLYAQDQSQFTSARQMSYESIQSFFEQRKPTG